MHLEDIDMKAIIKAISYYLPERILTNEALIKEFPEWSVEKIADKTGIKERRIVEENICSSDIGILSCQKLFKEHNISPNEIDFLILCTQSPDYFLPTTACIMQEKLGIPRTAGALDFNLGCSGYVYGLSLAKGLIETGSAKNVLLVMAETYSKFIHLRDKSVRTIFGDAAAATLLGVEENPKEEPIGSFVFGTDGRGANNLIVKTGGMRNPTKSNSTTTDEYGNIHDENSLYMNGSEIFIFTLGIVPKTMKGVLQKANLNQEDIDLFVFHQANQYMLTELRKKLKIPEEKFYIYLENCGNTVSSTIPIALYHAMQEGKIKKGSRVMIMGFGVGYSWAGALLQF
jgi:3-oxoacyl-[acyl-carrier-protein] synthase-3